MKKPTEWTWATDGRSVFVAGVEFQILPGKIEELEEFGDLFDEARWIFQRLHLADLAFQSGEAGYRDAVDRLRDLRRELAKADDELGGLVRGLGAFFSPTSIVQAFAGDDAALARFIREALEKLGGLAVHEETRAAPPAPEGT